MIKVTFIISGLIGGGAENMLLKLLKNIDRTRFSPVVVSMTNEGTIGPKISSLGIEIHTLNMRRGKIPNPLKIFHLINLLHKYKPHIIHTWMYHADLFGGIAARIAGFNKIIWSIRHSNLSPQNNSVATLLIIRVCALLSFLIPKAIVSCSYAAKDVHVSIGYAKENFHIIPNGFELENFMPDVFARVSVRSELGLSTEVQLVGLIARFHSQKNHIGFIRAASIIAIHNPSVHFLLVGNGVDLHNAVMIDEITKINLQDRMHLLGPRNDIPRLMASLDVLVSSSHGEAFPNVLGEAMACGVPCAVTDVGDSADIIGNTGRVVSAGDMDGLALEVLDLLEMTASDRVILGERARSRVATKYEIKLVVNTYEKLYEKLYI